MDAILSLDIGGTKMAASMLTRDGTLLAKERELSRAREGPGPMIDRLLAMSRRAASTSGARFSTVGISAGGPLDPVAGLILSPPNLPGWDRTPLRERIAAGLGLPESSVVLENDANACALAELRFGAGRGRRHFIFLTMSTGMGGGLVLDGRLYRGAAFNAGEVGHQVVLPDGPACGCGGRGCLEAVASGSGIASRLRERFESLSPRLKEAAGGRESISAEHLLDAARAGDPVAAAFLDETIALLARGIANLVFILNPEMVILGTIARHAGDLLMGPLDAAVRRICWPVLTRGLEIVATPLGSRLEELSGLAVALEAEKPTD
ncbi:MAG TPA: ROK family protein [Candidatus Polarisedimenticolia bacterium]|jgi:glucokinase